MDLHKIANTPGFGSGEAARNRLAEKAQRRRHIPPRNEMNEMSIDPHGAPIASFGHDSEDGRDYQVTVDGYGSTTCCSNSAGDDARAFVALWNAYRDGDLVWAESEAQPTP